MFRPYGIRVYLTARFSAPIEIGGLKTADPLDPAVRAWWKAKADEIYAYVPDFGGFLVKANSEGQPGPQDYKRTHADGANMLADAVAPHGGIVMWRAFVYSNDVPTDRVKQAYDEFKPLDGQFRDNVLVQVKNGPLDFQPREPFSSALRRDAEDAADDGIPDHEGIPRRRTRTSSISAPLLRGSARRRHVGARQGLDGRQRDRRVAARLRAHRHRGRREHRHRSQLDGVAVQSGELVRVRPARVGSTLVVGRDRRRVDRA